MLDNKRFMVCRVLALCLSVALGAFIAFKLAKKPAAQVTQEIPTTQNTTLTVEEQRKEQLEAQEKQKDIDLQDMQKLEQKEVAAKKQTAMLQEVPTSKKTVKPHVTKKTKKQAKPVVTQKQVVPQEAPLQKETQEPIKPVEPKKVVTPTIKVTNMIKKEMTGYKKFGKTWYPDEYHVSCNGVELEPGQSLDLKEGKTCTFSFEYDFRPMGKSYKKGAEELEYTIPSGTKSLDIAFSWYEQPTIIIRNQKEESEQMIEK